MAKTLGELKKGQSGRILSILSQSPESSQSQDPLSQRLMEMGLLVGCDVEVLHEAPLSRDPIVVRVRGALIALRRNEASYVQVS